MVASALVSEVSLYRPQKETSTAGKQTFSFATVHNVKLAQSSKGYTNDVTGETSLRSSVLYYNFDSSFQEPVLSPRFKAGDIVCVGHTGSSPSDDRFVVKSVTEHTFKGKRHHFEVVMA